jgi:hypothetical protein
MMQRKQWVAVAELLGCSLPIVVAVGTREGKQSIEHDQQCTLGAPMPHPEAGGQRTGILGLWKLRLFRS